MSILSIFTKKPKTVGLSKALSENEVFSRLNNKVDNLETKLKALETKIIEWKRTNGFI